jgi:hypothetical protein
MRPRLILAALLLAAAPFLFAATQNSGLRTQNSFIANANYTTVAGTPITLAHTQPAAFAFIFLSTECPTPTS